MSTESPTGDYGELRQTIGRLEGRVESLADGQRESREETQSGQRDLRNEVQVGFAEMNRRIDRLFYAILGIGGGIVAAMLAGRFISAG